MHHYALVKAQVAELVDAHGSGPCAARCGGSSPLLGTTKALFQAAPQKIRGCTPLRALPHCGGMIMLYAQHLFITQPLKSAWYTVLGPTSL